MNHGRHNHFISDLGDHCHWICCNCGAVVLCEDSPEYRAAMQAEYDSIFGDQPRDEIHTICDDCFEGVKMGKIVPCQCVAEETHALSFGKKMNV